MSDLWAMSDLWGSFVLGVQMTSGVVFFPFFSPPPPTPPPVSLELERYCT